MDFCKTEKISIFVLIIKAISEKPYYKKPKGKFKQYAWYSYHSKNGEKWNDDIKIEKNGFKSKSEIVTVIFWMNKIYMEETYVCIWLKKKKVKECVKSYRNSTKVTQWKIIGCCL